LSCSYGKYREDRTSPQDRGHGNDRIELTNRKEKERNEIRRTNNEERERKGKETCSGIANIARRTDVSVHSAGSRSTTAGITRGAQDIELIGG
jgi:hypothetical protein